MSFGKCHACGADYQRATGKFCGGCGVRRQSSTATTATAPPPASTPTLPKPTVSSTTATKQQPSQIPSSKTSSSPPPPPTTSATTTTLPPLKTSTTMAKPLGRTGTRSESPSTTTTTTTTSSSKSPASSRPPSGLGGTIKMTTTTTSQREEVEEEKKVSSSAAFSATSTSGTAVSARQGSFSNKLNTSSTTTPTASPPLRPGSSGGNATINSASSTTNNNNVLMSSTMMKQFAEVQKCLEVARLENLLPKFVEMNITDEALPFVEEEDLIQAGVVLGAHRRQLLAAFVPNQKNLTSTTSSSSSTSSPQLGGTQARRNSTQMMMENSQFDQLSDTQLYQEKQKNILQQELSESPYKNGNNNNATTTAPIQTIRMPEDGSLLSPEILETANAPQLRAWKKGNLLGRGSFGACWFGLVPSTGKFYAVKTMGVNLADPNNPNGGIRARDVIRISREISMMRRIQHENVCQFYGCVYNSEEREVCLFMELMLGGTLSAVASKFRPLPAEIIRNWTRQLVTGLAYLHKHQIAHRDLKADNVLVDANTNVRPTAQLKLADFGAAKRLADEFQKTSTIVGSPYWLAPELLTHTDGYDAQKADIYSLGNTICEFITGRPPWPEKSNAPQAILMIAQAEYPTQLPTVESGAITQNCLNFVMKCFKKDPKLRPSAEELLEEPYLKGDIDP